MPISTCFVSVFVTNRDEHEICTRAKFRGRGQAEQIGQDGPYLLEQVYAGGHHPELAQLPAVEMLRRVWIQHFYQYEDRVFVREKRDQPPASRLILSPYDPDARCSTKRNVMWVGYKVHLTETCDEDTPI